MPLNAAHNARIDDETTMLISRRVSLHLATPPLRRLEPEPNTVSFENSCSKLPSEILKTLSNSETHDFTKEPLLTNYNRCRLMTRTRRQETCVPIKLYQHVTRVLWPYVLGNGSPISYLFESIAPHFDEDLELHSLAQKDAELPDAVSRLTLSGNQRRWKLLQYVRFSLSQADLIHTGARERVHRRVSQLSKLRNRNIAHVHTFRVDVDPDGKFDTSALAKLAQQADTVTAVSEHTAETVREHIGTDPEVIYNGVDTEWFHPNYDHPTLFNDCGLNEPVFLYVGSMEQRKRPDHILAAAEATPEGSFLLIGDGPMLNYLRERASDLDNVLLPGRITKDRLPAIYANARALIFPTVREGCPNVVLESMAAGTPVIGYRATSMPELVDHGKTGLLAPTGEIDSLIENITKLAKKEGSGLGSCARSYVRKHHKFETIADDYESLYRATL